MGRAGLIRAAGWTFRHEAPGDESGIDAVIRAAFAGVAHGSGTEAAIVAALRNAGALAISLVAESEGQILGHAAFSPVTIDRHPGRWFGLGPLSVLPDRQRAGIGAGLIEEGLARLAASGAKGCVVLGDPAYYRRFGFACDPALRYSAAPAEYFQSIVIAGHRPKGEVAYHEAFAAG